MQPLPHLEHLVAEIHRLRNSDRPSRTILPRNRNSEDRDEPIGVLLLKPSSGYFPPETIQGILERLVHRHHYHIRSVVWWNGRDLRANKIMSLHYPGFHRIAHGGFGALAPAAQAALRDCCGNGEAFRVSFGVPFDLGLVRTSYDLIEQGMSPERLNDLWELDRSKEPEPLKRIQKLDDDGRCLALNLAEEEGLPAPARQRSVILLNGFFAKLEKDFEARGCVAILIQKESASATSWDGLRTNYAGKTNPFQAPAGTIRGDAARGALKVETVSILANVIHLSATEAEGQHEAEDVWWNPKRLSSAVGACDVLDWVPSGQVGTST